MGTALHPLAALAALCALLGSTVSQPSHEAPPQDCSEGYEWEDATSECRDVDECTGIPDACRGDMMCVNHFGGYMCLPRSALVITGGVQPGGMQLGGTDLSGPQSGLPGQGGPELGTGQDTEIGTRGPATSGLDGRRPGGPRPGGSRHGEPSPGGSRPGGPRQGELRPGVPRTAVPRPSEPRRDGPRPGGTIIAEPRPGRPRSGDARQGGSRPDVTGQDFEQDNDFSDQGHRPQPPDVNIPAETPLPPPTSRCQLGYKLSEGFCIDVDECEVDTHRCAPPLVCANTPGSYRCQCLPGFRMGARGACQDVDECLRSPCQHRCINTVGSFECQCPAGYSVAVGGRNCADVDECTESSPCAQRCLNTPGSFLCRCERGYLLERDGRTCRDIDECSAPVPVCRFSCQNIPGSYECQCPEGYEASEGRCTDIDECDLGVHGCTDSQSCFNTPGSMRCLQRDKCTQPYSQTSDDTCVCPRDLAACRNRPYMVRYRYAVLSPDRRPQSTVYHVHAATRYPGARNSFHLHDTPGSDGAYFSLRQTGPYSAVLTLLRSLSGPRDIILDVEMVSVQPYVRSGSSSSVLRLTLFVTAQPF
ncbi:EGF-containing fibulin-like extracellular matrix protein 2 [Lethenteron reissneri]|uniref:EGF-containing fibulin-like extracellular matrix protein 2 n=1 Tax=Lethenteron reissneri TaxID=7753 RepID=UPI002AB70FE3|nr:EGF-containing fibulin-like extracellular matrix protein 2 [Lethenteron reissneri]